MPFDNTAVIPTEWSKHHQAAAAGAMNARVSIGNPGPAVYDPATDQTDTTWSADYEGPARIQVHMRSKFATLAGQQISGRPYIVQLDAATTGADHLEPGMRVHVTQADNDASLVGQHLWIIDFQMGSERFARDLVCSDNESDIPSAGA